MDKLKIILEDGNAKEVDCIFYLYNSIYYFIYTEREIDANGYVVLHITKVGKETIDTPNGKVDTGYMIGVEITDPTEWASVQQSISKIVEDKKNNTQSPEIQYFSPSMLSTLKITGKKTFRLMKSIIENSFGLKIEETVAQELNQTPVVQNINPDVPITPIQPHVEAISNPVAPPLNQLENLDSTSSVMPTPDTVSASTTLNTANTSNDSAQIDDVVIDYRTAFFEQQEKNKQLQAQIESLTSKLDNVKKIIE